MKKYRLILLGFGCLAQLIRASRLHREGRGFESLNTHQDFKSAFLGAFYFIFCPSDTLIFSSPTVIIPFEYTGSFCPETAVRHNISPFFIEIAFKLLSIDTTKA